MAAARRRLRIGDTGSAEDSAMSRDPLLEQLRQLNRELEKRVAERTQALQETNRLLEQRTHELEQLARTDPLTGLYNRRAIEELARFELKRHTRYPSTFALGLIDVDHFKDVNTRYLLPGGDEALKGLARLLTASSRAVDSVGRLGGDEFLILARETNREGATRLAERLRTAAAETPIACGSHVFRMTVSAGFAVLDGETPADFDSLYRLAATALQDAKDNGRNRFVIRLFPEPEDRTKVR